ncbi:putative ankyrin repeat protein RF_0381 [Halyomorpha halys]|uniref:putative ankyrin repeat protein RF_0381 n=1 Tax=Halyomorpha halys TaxID=286706 RepID=UPI0006D4D410|nr:uncharacterized protein LOC106691733 [Halyomorpha halys]XP_014293077.1 uncharacterized protein LOC106691733 [Halyomorpha halys]
MTSHIGERPLEQLALLCRNIAFSKLLSGVNYGAASSIYKPITIAAMELSTPQCLLLALVNSLVTGDVASCFLLADICHLVQQLQSKHLKVWLSEDFLFPRNDIQKGIALLTELLVTGALKMPDHVIEIMSSLGIKYGTPREKLTLLKKGPVDFAAEMENAVSNDSPSDIITLVTAGADVNGLTQCGDSLLHLAARTGKCASIAVLGFLQADLEVVNSDIATPLEVAVRNNSVKSVNALLKAGAKIDHCVIRGDTYAHIAAAGGQNGSLLALLEAGIEANRENHLGETPLVQAVRAGNVRGVEILLERGGNTCTFPVSRGLVKKAVESQNVDLFKAFMKNGVLPDLTSEDGETIVHFVARSGNAGMLKVLKDRKVTANIKNKEGTTPLHVASDPSIARMLLGMGANSDTQDNRGSTALMIAVKNSKINIVNFLLHNGSNPNIKDKEGRTPLHYAVERSCIESVSMLLVAGATVDVKDNKGDTPAFIAATNNIPIVVEILVENGADLTQRDTNGDGILHRAARSGHADVVSLLLNAGAAVDMKGKGDRTALHWASEVGHANVVSVLLDRGADPEAKASCCTPLIFAAYNGCLDVVKLLVDRGASLNEKSTVGRTAYGYANDKGHKAVADYLKLKGGI